MEDDRDFEMIEFWGEEVPPGAKPYSVEVENEPPIFHMIHVTCCALGEDPKKGPHTLKAVHNGKPIALATLEKGACTQFALDFGISSTTTFVNTGSSPVYISGYITRSVQHFEGSDEEDEDEDEEDESEEFGDDEEPPKLVPLKGAAPGAKKRASPFVDDEAEETDEGSSEEGSEEDEDEEDEDEEGDEFDRRLGAKSFGGGSSDDEDGGGSDDEDEDEEALPELDSDDIVAEAESDEDGMETGSSDEDDEGESGSDDDSDEDRPPEERPNAAPKRPAQAATPQPAKKAKKEEQRVPASAPPKVQQQQQQKPSAGKQQQPQQQKQAGGGGDEAQYLSDIVAYIKSQPAPVPLAALGTRVKRPEGLKTKAKAFILAHADKLAFDEKAQTVSLKKK